MAENLKEENKARAFTIYRQSRRIQNVCDVMGISYATALRWRTEDSWDERIMAEQSSLPAKLNDDKFLIPQLSQKEIQEKLDNERLQLDVMEMRAVAGIVIDDIRPHTWRDILSTLSFVAERRDKLADKIARVALGAKQTITSTVETVGADGSKRTITIEDEVYAKNLAHLLNSERQDLSTLTKIVESTQMPEGIPSKSIIETAKEAAITLPTSDFSSQESA